MSGDRDLFARRAAMAARHGAGREARAWALAKLLLAARLFAHATARRERAERVYVRAVEDEARVILPWPRRPRRDVPPRELEDGSRQPVPVESPPPHGEWAWRAMRKLAACGEDEARAAARCKRLALALRDPLPVSVLDEDYRAEWSWNEAEIPF